MLEHMEAANLVTRAFDPSDRRQVRISLTGEARALRGEYDRVSRKMNGIYYAGFSDDEVGAFEEILRRILKNLNESEKQLRLI